MASEKKQKVTTSAADEKTMMVTKANSLIQQSRYALSILDQKILLRIIALVDPKSNDEHPHVLFDLKEFLMLCGNEIGHGNNYQATLDELKYLRDQSFIIKNPETGADIIMGWISNAEINPIQGKVDIKIDEKIVPYLTNLHSLYTTYNVNYVLSMQSTYSIRFYELFKSWDNGDGNYSSFYDVFLPVDETIDTEHLGWRYKDFDLDELKNMLSPTKAQLAEKMKRKYEQDLELKEKGKQVRQHRDEKPLTEKYKNFSDFRRFVLDKAFDEITALTDLDVDYLGINRRGTKKVEKIRVFLRYKPKDQIEEIKRNFHVANAGVVRSTRSRRAKKKDSSPTLFDMAGTPSIIQDVEFSEEEQPQKVIVITTADAKTEKTMLDKLYASIHYDALAAKMTEGQLQAMEEALAYSAQLCRRNIKGKDDGYVIDHGNTKFIKALNKVLEVYGSLDPLYEVIAKKYDFDHYLYTLAQNPKIIDASAVYRSEIEKAISNGLLTIKANNPVQAAENEGTLAAKGRNVAAHKADNIAQKDLAQKAMDPDYTEKRHRRIKREE